MKLRVRLKVLWQAAFRFCGHPAHDLLPIEGIQRTLATLWQGREVTRLFDYGDAPGNPQLIDFLVERLNRVENLGIEREHLMIIGGLDLGRSI